MSEYLFELTNHLASLAQHSENAAFKQLAATLSGLPQNRPTPGSSSCPTSEKSLDEAIQSLPDRLSISDVAEKAARLSPWAEASRGIPEFFAGGYAYSILVDEHGGYQSVNHCGLRTAGPAHEFSGLPIASSCITVYTHVIRSMSVICDATDH